MRRRKTVPLELYEILPRLARQDGAERLRRPALDGNLRRALGAWLGERLLSWRRDGSLLELVFAGESAARDAKALSAELLGRLQGCFASEPPQGLRVLRGPEPERPRRGKDGPPPRPLSEPGAGLREALQGIEDPDIRAKLARIAARGEA